MQLPAVSIVIARFSTHLTKPWLLLVNEALNYCNSRHVDTRNALYERGTAGTGQQFDAQLSCVDPI
jgi:hypothetical protein